MLARAHVVQVGAVLDEELDEEAIYVMHRTFDDSGLRRDDKQLYLQGLQVTALGVLVRIVTAGTQDSATM